MKRIITLTFVFMMVFSLFISCNDGEEGLFQMAANSVKKESFKILNIINKESDNVYIVATDNGIAKYDTETESFSNFIGNGVMATNAVWASSDGNHFIYYDTESKAYLNEDGIEETINNLENKIPQPFYSPNGTEFTYVFKEKDGSKYYSLYLDSSLTKDEFKDKCPTLIDIDNIESVTIIGNGVLRVITTDKKTYTYHADSDLATTLGKSIPTNTIIQGVSDDMLFLSRDGSIGLYPNQLNSEDAKSLGFTIDKKPAMYSIFDDSDNPTYSYIIPEGSSSIIEVKWNGDDFTKDTKTVTGLQNITVIAIIDKKDTNKLLVLTANNGLQELEMK